MNKVFYEYPHIYLDIEVYRPCIDRRGSGCRRAGFFAYDTKLAGYAIAVEYDPNNVEYHVNSRGNERELLDEVNNVITSVLKKIEKRRSKPLIGYNILAYDLPYIVMKTRKYYNRRHVDDLLKKLYRGFIQIDLFQIALLFYEGEGLPSTKSFLEEVYYIYGEKPPEKESGYKVHELYEHRRYDLIKEYARNEIELLVKLYNMLINKQPIRNKCLNDEWSKLVKYLTIPDAK